MPKHHKLRATLLVMASSKSSYRSFGLAAALSLSAPSISHAECSQAGVTLSCSGTVTTTIGGVGVVPTFTTILANGVTSTEAYAVYVQQSQPGYSITYSDEPPHGRNPKTIGEPSR